MNIKHAYPGLLACIGKIRLGWILPPNMDIQSMFSYCPIAVDNIPPRM